MGLLEVRTRRRCEEMGNGGTEGTNQNTVTRVYKNAIMKHIPPYVNLKTRFFYKLLNKSLGLNEAIMNVSV